MSKTHRSHIPFPTKWVGKDIGDTITVVAITTTIRRLIGAQRENPVVFLVERHSNADQEVSRDYLTYDALTGHYYPIVDCTPWAYDPAVPGAIHFPEAEPDPVTGVEVKVEVAPPALTSSAPEELENIRRYAALAEKKLAEAEREADELDRNDTFEIRFPQVPVISGVNRRMVREIIRRMEIHRNKQLTADLLIVDHVLGQMSYSHPPTGDIGNGEVQFRLERINQSRDTYGFLLSVRDNAGRQILRRSYMDGSALADQFLGAMNDLRVAFERGGSHV